MSLLKLTTPPMRGDEVRRVQLLLASAGHSPGAVDGVFGPKTDDAVRAFQAANGLTVDGIVGPNTLAALVAKSAATQPASDDARFPIVASEEQPPPTLDNVEMTTTCKLSSNGTLSGRTIIRNRDAWIGHTVGVVVRLLDRGGNVLDTAVPAPKGWGFDGINWGWLGKSSTRDERWEMQIDDAVTSQTHGLEILQLPAPRDRWADILAEVQDKSRSLAEAYQNVERILGSLVRT